MVAFSAILPALKTAGSWLGSNVGNIASFGGSFMGLFGSNSAKKSFEYSKALQQHQYELERESRKTAYQDTRYSLEQAGFNPLLATGQQSGSLPVGNQMSVQDERTENLQNAVSAMSALSGARLQNAQAENLKADTDVKKYGQKGAILKNVLKFVPESKKKQVVAEVVGYGNSSNISNSAVYEFKRNHPTTISVLRKLRQGDFVGAKYAIDARRRRIESSRANSAISSKKKSDDFINYINSYSTPTAGEIRKRKAVNHSYSSKRSYNRPPSYVPY